MIRAKWLNVVGYYEQNLKYSHDYDLWLRLAEVTKLANIPIPLYQYRRHATSVTSRHRYLQMYYKALALERAVTRRHGSHPPRNLTRLVARDYLRAACIGFMSSEKQDARICFGRAIAIAPEICQSGTLVEEVLFRYLLRQQPADVYKLVESFFVELFPTTPYLARLKSRLLSRFHMQEVFEAARQGRYERADEHWWAGVRYDPRWLANRGVWVIGLQRLFGRQR
jgi:tetratricopeptide (TPR) repeat protein